jgi:hypothetical protein
MNSIEVATMFGFIRFVMTVCLAAVLWGCVSVRLPGQKEVVKSTHIQSSFKSSQYEKLNVQWADEAWKHKKTGAVISYFSECGTDPSLDSLLNEALLALDKYEIKSSQEVTFNSRLAIERTVVGTIDGVPVNLEILVFKKDSCNYTLSHSSKDKEAGVTEPDFAEFKKNFKVP